MGRKENPGNNMTVIVTSFTEKEHLEIHFQTQQRQEASGLYEEADGTVSKFTDCVKWGGVIDTQNSRALVQRNLQKVEGWDNRSFMSLSKKKCKFLHSGQSNSSSGTKWQLSKQQPGWKGPQGYGELVEPCMVEPKGKGKVDHTLGQKQHSQQIKLFSSAFTWHWLGHTWNHASLTGPPSSPHFKEGCKGAGEIQQRAARILKDQEHKQRLTDQSGEEEAVGNMLLRETMQPPPWEILEELARQTNQTN